VIPESGQRIRRDGFRGHGNKRQATRAEPPPGAGCSKARNAASVGRIAGGAAVPAEPQAPAEPAAESTGAGEETDLAGAA